MSIFQGQFIQGTPACERAKLQRVRIASQVTMPGMHHDEAGNCASALVDMEEYRHHVLCRAAFEVSRHMSERLITALKACGSSTPLDLDAVVQVCTAPSPASWTNPLLIKQKVPCR